MLNLIGKVWPSLQPFPLCVRNFLRELYAVDGNFSFEIELKQQKEGVGVEGEVKYKKFLEEQEVEAHK